MTGWRSGLRSALVGAAEILGLAVLPALATAYWHPRSPYFITESASAFSTPQELAAGEVTLAEVREWETRPFWIDARSAGRYEREHVPGAVLLNEAEWEARLFDVLAVLPADRPVVVYCDGRRCDASHAVARRLRDEVGLESVYVLHGGWDAWKASQP